MSTLALNGGSKQGVLLRVRSDVPEGTRNQLCPLLNARLADAIDLQLQAKQAHWNVKGPQFIALHQLFDKVAAETAEAVDLLAERVVQLGGVARGTLREVARHSSLKDYPLDILAGAQHVEALALGLAGFAQHLRKDIERCTALRDAGSADLLTEISRSTDQSLWFVEAHLEPHAA